MTPNKMAAGTCTYDKVIEMAQAVLRWGSRRSPQPTTGFAYRAPRARRNTERRPQHRAEVCAFLGSPYGANPSTERLWESAPKGRGGVFADTLNVCPRRRAPRPGWRGRGVPKAGELRQGRQGRL